MSVKTQWLKASKVMDKLETFRESGIPEGFSTGWGHMDENFMILKDQLNVVSGYPGSGKSEWVECVACNLVRYDKWTIFMYAPESHPDTKHTQSLVEKIVGKQMLDGYRSPQMSQEELAGAVYEVDKQFRILSADDHAYSFEEILETVEKIKSTGRALDMVIIDPLVQVSDRVQIVYQNSRQYFLSDLLSWFLNIP